MVKNKAYFCLLVFLILILSGCTMFRQPVPQPNQPQPSQPQQPNVPQMPQEPQQPQQSQQPSSPGPGADQGNVLNQPLASNISSRAMALAGVNNAATIVIGNLALIGVELENGVDGQLVRDTVIRETEQNFSEIQTALVSSDAELFDKISSASDRINQGSSTESVMDELVQIWERMRP